MSKFFIVLFNEKILSFSILHSKPCIWRIKGLHWKLLLLWHTILCLYRNYQKVPVLSHILVFQFVLIIRRKNGFLSVWRRTFQYIYMWHIFRTNIRKLCYLQLVYTNMLNISQNKNRQLFTRSVQELEMLVLIMNNDMKWKGICIYLFSPNYFAYCLTESVFRKTERFKVVS